MEVKRLTNGINGSYWLITFTDVRNCWICNKKSSWKLSTPVSVLNTALKSVNHFFEKHLKECSVSSYLQHDESLAVRWEWVNRSQRAKWVQSQTVRELLCFAVVSRLSFCSLFISLYPPTFPLPFLTEQQTPLMTDRPTSQSESGAGRKPCGRGWVKLIQRLSNSLKRCFISVEY